MPQRVLIQYGGETFHFPTQEGPAVVRQLIEAIIERGASEWLPVVRTVPGANLEFKDELDELVEILVSPGVPIVLDGGQTVRDFGRALADLVGRYTPEPE